MDSEERGVSLTSAQVRAVSATLRVVEEAVDGIERLLAAPRSGLTVRRHDDLDPAEREAIGRACGRIRPALAKGTRCLGVECWDRSLRAEIRGECAVVWAAVQDTRSRALRGYGPLSSEAAEVLDSLFGEISDSLADILRQLASAHPRGTAPGLPSSAGVHVDQP
jgi:hypothetical protein